MAFHHLDEGRRQCDRSSSCHHPRERERVRPRGREGDEEEEYRDRKRRHRDSEEAKVREASQRRRVIEWRKKLQEQQLLRIADADSGRKAGKKWSLENEEDSDEERDSRQADSMDAGLPNLDCGGASSTDQDEVDPLDAFMNSMVLPEVARLQSAAAAAASESSPPAASRDMKAKAAGRIIMQWDDGSDSDGGEEAAAGVLEDDEEFMKRVVSRKQTKAEKLANVDHSTVDYPPFRKSFYIESPEVAKTTGAEAEAYRKQLEIKVHGKDVPKPIRSWVQSGLTSKLLDAIRNKLGFDKPMPIQAQALPVIMSGRDCIGIAKTGSGKTLAFVLPMLRHVKDQPPGDGPVALVVAPTRELVAQIHSDTRKLCKPLGIRCAAVYGGSGVAQQIGALKRGAEIVVCTPGRMIDILLCAGGSGNNNLLRRVTFLVMDEADRMFDLGFEPQITRIVHNTRPDRQTVLFSATFPRQVEALARKVLTRPVEIEAGGRSVANRDVTQLVEVRPEGERFPRLLELLGDAAAGSNKTLVFVHTQDRCDSLLRELLRHGYPCMSLHGGKEQADRESTIADFKGPVCDLLVATSVAARGLDVRELDLVVNYDVPNHYEDYVHRVGRTGRAGRKGTAVTFISREEERYAPDLVRALELSGQAVPNDVRAMADVFMAKVKQGTEQAHGTGYGGSGFKFNDQEDEARRSAKKSQAREHGYESDSDSDPEDEVAGQQTPLLLPAPVVALAPSQQSSDDTVRALRADIQQHLARMLRPGLAAPEHHEAELQINDLPQNARWNVTRRETLAAIEEWTGASISTRGVYVPHGKHAGANERKLYLRIQGPAEQDVNKAKAELKRILEDCATKALNVPTSANTGRYSVL